MTGELSMEVVPSSLAKVLEKLSMLGIDADATLAVQINIIAHKVESTAKDNLADHTKSGELRDSIHVTEATPVHLQAEVSTNKDYAMSIEKSAKPHVIVPVNGLALHFELDGDDVFATSVQHPGNPAFPFLEPALTEHQEDLVSSMGLAIQMALMK